MSKKLICASAMIMACAVTTPAMSAEPGFYVGAGAGISSVSESGYKDSNPFKVFGGYNFNSSFGFELGAINFGKYVVDNAFFSAGVKVDALQMALVGYMPVGNDFSLLGKIGVYSFNAKASPCLNSDCSNSDEGGFAAVGVQYMFTKNFGMRSELEYYNDAGGTDVTALTASLLGQF